MAACFSGRNNLPRVDAKFGDMIGAMVRSFSMVVCNVTLLISVF
jgi:hypothetical protein